MRNRALLALLLTAGCGNQAGSTDAASPAADLASQPADGSAAPKPDLASSTGTDGGGHSADLAMNGQDGGIADASAVDLSAAALPDGATPDLSAVAAVDMAIAQKPDLGVSPDLAAAHAPDLAVQTMTIPPGTLQNLAVLGAGNDYQDASSDQGGNVWAVTKSRVDFWQSGTGGARSFDQGAGLAHGQSTWTDTYWFGTPQNPSTQQVQFTAVAGGMSGQAFIGNIGFTGDRLEIDPSSGAVRSLVSLAVTSAQQPDPTELAAQQQREVATWHAVIDLNGTYNGAAYFGGWHGTSSLYNMTVARSTSTCACSDYEEHIHPFDPNGNPFGTDVHALFMTALGDVWIGDRKAIYFLPQGSMGNHTDLFLNFNGNEAEIPGKPNTAYLVPFPNAPNGDNWIYGIASDAKGGVYVASYGQGFAYLAPSTYEPTYYTTAQGLPTDDLTGLDIDGNGEVWIATASSGVLRFTPSLGTFTHYTSGGGLPSDHVRQIYSDKFGKRAIYIATDNGVGVYTGP